MKYFVVNNSASASDLQIVPAVSGKKIRITNLALQPDSAVVVTVNSGTAGGSLTPLTGPMKLSTSGFYPGSPPIGFGGMPQGFFESATGEGVALSFGAGVQVSGYGSYEEVN